MVLIDSSTDSNYSWNIDENHPSAIARNSGAGQISVQGLLSSGSYRITEVQFRMSQYQGPDDTIVAKIYTQSESNLPDVLLATSDPVSILSLPVHPAAPDWISFPFSGNQKVVLPIGSTIIVLYENPTTGINMFHYIKIRLKLTGGTHSGITLRYANSTWQVLTYDTDFRLYGDEVVKFPTRPQGGERYIEFLICHTCGKELGQSGFHCTRSPFEGVICFCDLCGGRVYP